MQLLVAVAMLTLALVVVFIVATRLRRAAEVAGGAALMTAWIVNAGLLLLFWVPIALPLVNGWLPAKQARPDLLVPVRPCRGALLWESSDRGLDFGVVDDIWLHFADPRRSGALTRAIPVSGRWRSEYLWLDANDLGELRVRSDDPAVIHCDSRARPERVAPAAWHKLGVEW